MTETVQSAPRGQEAAEQPAVQVSNLGKSFGAVEVLRDIELEISTGEVITLIGPSGSGKSTLIRCMNLLETPSSGTLQVMGETLVQDGKILPKRSQLQEFRAKVGMVFQSFNLFPHLSALENISLAQVHTLGRRRAEADERSAQLLDSVGLGQRMNHMPAHLSGGQQQRVAIARALAMDPDVMLFDEPTSAIDPELRVEVLKVMRDLAQSGMTMAIVTHELKFARMISDQVLFLADGTIVERGTPDELFGAPQHERTHQFLAAIEETKL
ncbi:amino acid ABC transporter ATP-binding protein [Nesterenkonia muleiensis]|uniref:amino acid ABC transporter ATP-binding protein n=1 Tax=Nesterenkonia muleiensis TaxID=2282648 RepID=UPI000E7430CA|nr:amino acid ABC transporter ATP-binding protein [Nesterenkonia muleiensis]